MNASHGETALGLGKALMSVISERAPHWEPGEILFVLACVAANVVSLTDCPGCRQGAAAAFEKLMPEMMAEAERLIAVRDGSPSTTSRHWH
jgi:hypothetical protein